MCRQLQNISKSHREGLTESFPGICDSQGTSFCVKEEKRAMHSLICTSPTALVTLLSQKAVTCVVSALIQDDQQPNIRPRLECLIIVYLAAEFLALGCYQASNCLLGTCSNNSIAHVSLHLYRLGTVQEHCLLCVYPAKMCMLYTKCCNEGHVWAMHVGAQPPGSNGC